MAEPRPKTVLTRSPEETLALGARLGRGARPGQVIALIGDLGAGKTILTKGIAKGLDADPDAVTSPTFVLMIRHDARLPLFHFDAYRLTSARDLLDIGAEEAFYGEGVSVIEWADRVMDALPHERLDIHLAVAGQNDRRIRLIPRGPAARALLSRLAPPHPPPPAERQTPVAQ